MKYKGEIADFQQEVVEKMLERQMECDNKGDVSVFELCKEAGDLKGGFTWSNTIEGHNFWRDVIRHKNFDVFFAKYPKKQYPKVMMVSSTGTSWFKRVVVCEWNGGFVALNNAESIDNAMRESCAIVWNYAKEIEPEPEPEIELTIDEIAEKYGVKPEQIKIKK